MHSDSERQVWLYDGLCGFCDGSVQFLLARDKRKTLEFAALQGAFAQQVLASRPELRAADSLILVTERQGNDAFVVTMRSDAVLEIAKYLGAPWSFALVFRLIPRFIRDWAYDIFARNRYRMFGTLPSCRIPTAEERARFRD